MTTNISIILLPVLVLACGCESLGKAGATDKTPPVATSPASGTSVTRPAEGHGSVVKIIFIEQEQACKCTRDRIEKSWSALQAVLANVPGLTVERLAWDTQEKAVERYGAKRPLQVIPGLYFLKADGEIVDVLQGEVTAEQIQAVLR